jgi:hypothetical protein
MPFKSQGEHPENPVSLITGTPASLCPVNIKSIWLSKNRQSFGYSVRTKLDMVVWLVTEFKNTVTSGQSPVNEAVGPPNAEWRKRTAHYQPAFAGD